MSSSTPTPDIPPADSRDSSWDFVKGIAMLAVLVIHATGPYLSYPLPGLLWPVWEPAFSPAFRQATGVVVLDLLFWITRSFAVPLFCFVAGVFAAKSLASSAPRPFIKARFRRLGVPLLAGTLIVLPVMYVIWASGWVRFGWAAWEHLPKGHFGPAVQPHLFGFGHLWYLWYVLLYSVLIAAAWPGVRLVRSYSVGTLAPFVAILGIAVVGIFPKAVVQFTNSYIPEPGFFLYHLLFFAWGVLTSRRALDRGVSGGVTLAVFLGVFGLVASWVLTTAVEPQMLQQANGVIPELPASNRRLWIALASPWPAVSFILATLAISRLASAQWLCRIGRGSLWIYTTHLVWIGLSVLCLYLVAIPPECKALIALAAGLFGPMATARLVGRVRAGRWLGASANVNDPGGT